MRIGLIFRSDDSYRFLHDRVQEAAYSLIPEKMRSGAHLRIGMLLAAHTPETKREEAIFEIVNQLNRGSHLLTSVEDRERVAELNLIAGRRAKVSTAYASALKYLGAGRALLTEETWGQNYYLVFSTEFLMAECELLTADKVAAESRLSLLPQRANNRHDFCVATRLRLTRTKRLCEWLFSAIYSRWEWMSAENSLDNRSGRNQVGKQRSSGWSHAMSEFARKPAESSHALHTVSGPSGGPAMELAREKHYSVIEIAKLWALSEKTVRKIFEREPCVIHWSTEEKLHKRGYRTIRVPETVLHRVHRKLRRAS